MHFTFYPKHLKPDNEGDVGAFIRKDRKRMEKQTKDDIEQLFEEIHETDRSFDSYSQTWGALATFLTDYEHLKGLNTLTQGEIARSCGTTQSAISRLECMKGKPAYELLRKLSAAVGGELYLTPMADVSITAPYDLHDQIRKIAGTQNIETKELLARIIRDGIERAEYSLSGEYGVFNLVTNENEVVAPGIYEETGISGDERIAR